MLEEIITRLAISEMLPGWTEDEPAFYSSMRFKDGSVGEACCLKVRDPRGVVHAVVRPTAIGCIQFLRDLVQAVEETKHDPQIPDAEGTGVPGAVGPDPGSDAGSADPAGLHQVDHPSGGSAAADLFGLEADPAIADEARQDSPAEPELVATELIDRPGITSDALDAEATDPQDAGFSGGMMLEKDELRILKDKLISDINYAAADRIDAIARMRGELTAEEVRLFNEGQITKETDLDAINRVRDQAAALIVREAAIKRFATTAREGLEGKTLADLKTFDIAELPWPQ